MNEIEKILKENMEDYESLKRQALKFVHENQKELSKNYEYAGFCQDPLAERQLFAVVDVRKPGSELLLDMLKYLMQCHGGEYEVIACITGSFHLKKSPNITYVKEESRDYWRALAQSRFIFSNVILPGAFTKRQEQIYFNSMLGEMEVADTGEFISAAAREFLKTDYIYASSPKTAEENWLKKCFLGQVYDGKVLVVSQKQQKTTEGIGGLFSSIVSGISSKNVEMVSLRNGETKKKILILGSWKAEQQAKTVVQKLLESIDKNKYDILLYSGWLGGKSEVKEYLSFEKELPRIMGAGRMTLNQEDFLNYRMIEKNPAIYLENPTIRRYMKKLAKREWGRLFGNSSWDVVIMAGSTGYLPYYLAAEAPARMKVLVDLDFLPYVHEKYPARWRKSLTVFDRIYASADCQQLGGYGQENRLRIMRLPVLTADKPEQGQMEMVSYNGENYLVSENRRLQGERVSMKLVQKPVTGSILVNGELAPAEEQKEFLKQLAREHKLYVLGTQSAAYKTILPDAVVLDEYVQKELYLYPAAWEFFCAFSGYVGNPGLEDDVIEKLCKAFGVKKYLIK